MSKAFTKESDGDEPESEIEDSSLPTGLKNYMTPAGEKKLREELHELLSVKRPDMVKTVTWAASNGDRSENADYQYGKRRLREFDRRIRFLQKRLEIAEVIDPTTQKSAKILFGATVTLQYEDGAKKKYRIVGIDEADAGHGELSWIAPLAKAMLGRQTGDVVQLRSPKGEQEIEILKVEYL